MPGMYRKGEYDLAGCIVGVVDRKKMIDGARSIPAMSSSVWPRTVCTPMAIRSLARFFSIKCGSSQSRITGIKPQLARNCCACIRTISRFSQKFPAAIKGLAHITGGGLIDNLPRVLPKNCDAVIETKSWKVPRIFQILQENGNVDPQEMYQVFNMGIGMVRSSRPQDAAKVMAILRAKRIGQIERGTGKTRLLF